MISLPKEKPYRSAKYLDFVRSHECFDCGWPSELGHIESHHIRTGGIATKCGDNETIPLCGFYARGCHNKADKNPDSYERYKDQAGELFRRFKGVTDGKR